jgi:hypothetical protein
MPQSGITFDDGSRQLPDSAEPPSWALTYADAALRCGQTTPQIEATLVKKGLSTSIAESVVFKCLEFRIERAERARKARVTWKWVNAVAFLIVFLAVLAAYYVATYSLDLPARGAVRYAVRRPVALIPFAYYLICVLWGKCDSWNGSLARPVLLAMAGWFVLLALLLAIMAMAV